MSDKSVAVPLLHYQLGQHIVAFTTLREGGVSKGDYASFNINPYCGDDLGSVAINRQLLAKTLDIDECQIILPHQTHSNNVIVIDREFLQQPQRTRKSLLDNVDAIVCSEKGLCVGVSTADCVPVLLYDEANHVGAAIHAGWRGVVADIVGKTILQMQACYDTTTAMLRVVIAPCISLSAFEVGDEVYRTFEEKGFPMSKISSRIANRWHIDLAEAVAWQLQSHGVVSQEIYRSGECTYSASERYFSARQLGIHSGRLFTAFMLK